MSGLLPTDPKDQELLALRATVKMDEKLIAGLRLRSDRQSKVITNLLNKIAELEKEIEALDNEVIEGFPSYGGTD